MQIPVSTSNSSPKTPALMIQGTGSHVGKTLLVAGLCRLLSAQGICVWPFKPQNMSNNAAVTFEGGEIGRAQALQAHAAGLPPSLHMNPVLLKPESEGGAQLIVQGQRCGRLFAQDYARHKPALLARVLESFRCVQEQAELVLIEGAGSPAEINLRAGDIANMGFAYTADVPVVLVGDIDRGGVIASIVGTHAVLPYHERRQIKGFIINRFRGTRALFESGISEIERRTNWPCLGVVPWFEDAALLPGEDSLTLTSAAASGKASASFSSALSPSTKPLRIAVPLLPHLSNFDDLDPLRLEPEVDLCLIRAGQRFPEDAALVILPGSKATCADLVFFRTQGWESDLARHLERGGPILGICGGYQMLGQWIDDPLGIEGVPGRMRGLGLLDVQTLLTEKKILRSVRAFCAKTQCSLEGYLMHLGRTEGPSCTHPFLFLLEGSAQEKHPHGATAHGGHVAGCAVHGIFAQDAFRHAFLARLGGQGRAHYPATLSKTLDALAAHLERSLDLLALLQLCNFK